MTLFNSNAMLQRSLRRSLRHIAQDTSQSACTVCKCSCGRTFLQNGPSPQQKRSLTIKPKKTVRNPYSDALEVKKRKQEIEEWEATRYYDTLQFAKSEGALNTSVDNALAFLNEFVELAKVRRTRTGLDVDTEAFNQLLEEYNITNNDADALSRILAADMRKLEYRELGRKLMYTLSQCGHPWATKRIIIQILLRPRRSRSSLKSADLLPTRKHLTAMAERGVLDAMVLEGRVAYILGDVDHAIQMWTNSIDNAVALEEMFSTRPNRPQNAALEAVVAPWIELATVHALRGEHEKAKWAIKIGCEQDDPTSHFQALQYVDPDSSDWLYHVTKAAGAGHVKASHLLGYWYGFSDWKYLENEPPEHVKPTPFDSFPAKGGFSEGTPSILSQISATLGLTSPAAINIEPKNRLFLTAAFPSTAYDRFKMALQWLEISMTLLYAPSYLVAVNLLLQKNLHASASAPQSALDLTSDRYIYASSEDFYADKPIRRDEVPSKGQAAEEIPNPGYDPPRAKLLLREILYAIQAQRYRRDLLTQIETARKSGRNLRNWDEDQLDERSLQIAGASENIQKWFRYPENREMYTDDTGKGRLWDNDLGLDLEVEATRICDEQGWDVYDAEEGLMYRFGSRGKVLPPKWNGGLEWSKTAYS